jgi:hypothetical protein
LPGIARRALRCDLKRISSSSRIDSRPMRYTDDGFASSTVSLRSRIHCVRTGAMPARTSIATSGSVNGPLVS